MGRIEVIGLQIDEDVPEKIFAMKTAMLDEMMPMIDDLNARLNEMNGEITNIADSAQEALENLRQNAGSDWSDWSLLEDSDFQELKEKVEHFEGMEIVSSLNSLKERVETLEAAAPSDPAANESKRVQEMMEDLYRRIGDLEEEGERGAEGAGVGCARRPWLSPSPKYGEGRADIHRKPISESKAIMSLGPLTDEKAAFRQWDLKLVNALNMYNRAYGEAIKIVRRG